MILQCDQCQTKFRLDDSKLKPGGVKVRCSKCRHVFIAGAEPKQEESDFDAILSGLGAPPPEKQEEGGLDDLMGGFGFDEVPKPPAAEAKPAASAVTGAAPAAEAKAAPAETGGAPAATADDFPDFSSFGFPEESSGAEQKPAGDAGFGDFDFGAEFMKPSVPKEEAAAPEALDFGEFSFDQEPPPSKGEAAPREPAAEEGFDFGDFPLDTETAPKAEGEAQAAPEAGLGFGEFEFNPEPVAKAQEAPAAPELDFGELSFNEEPAPEPPAQAAEPAPAKEFDFGDFTFDEEPPPLKEAASAAQEFDLPGFSFDEEVAAKPEKPAGAAPAPAEEFSFGDFSFDEEPPQQVAKPAEPRQDEEFVLGDFSFAEGAAEPEAAPEPAAVFGGKAPAAETPAPEAEGGQSLAARAAALGLTAAGLAAARHAAGSAEEKGEAAPEQPAAKAPSYDFDFGAVPGKAEGYEGEEELPPLSIASRRKGRSLFTVSIVAVAVLVIVALSGAGLYLLQKGPAAAKTFNKMGLGFVGKWFGVETLEEGRITVKNPLASFYKNKEAGELFVVTGEAVNSYQKPRASIHVKVSIYDKKGAVLMQKSAYCGNRLSKEQLETLPMAKIDGIMNNQFGDSLANLGVKPGQGIGFVVAMANVPKDAADFGVEVVGSTVAGQ